MNSPEKTDTEFTMRLCGADIEVRIEASTAWARNGMGRSDQTNGTILLREGMPRTIRAQVFLHEMIHMISDMHDLKLTEQETSINILANALLAWVRDNPNLVKEMLM